ncbi:MAG: 1,4-dihydroxy-2-naphthoate polyprenyltransferase [Bacteroidota bacterium]|nr:1,4-dihydroxy-2-naphthoate polyprenyltransferase [Bacteroidota bacterium]
MSEPNAVQVWFLAARPKTLPAAVAPVLVGTAMAWEAGGFHPWAALCALVCALLIQIGTNFCNDYADFVRGADTCARKGPLRVTQAGLISVRAMRAATVIVFTAAALLGGYLIARGGEAVLAIGLASIAAGVLYTSGRFPLGYLGLGDILVLLFFGPIAVGGTYYVQTLEITATVIVAGFAPGLLATAILLVNNIRDIDQDRAAGKKTTIVRFGRRFGLGLWVGCVVIAALLPLEITVASGGQHTWAGSTALILIPAMAIFHKLRTSTDSKVLNPLLGQTAALLLAYSILFSVGWII